MRRRVGQGKASGDLRLQNVPVTLSSPCRRAAPVSGVPWYTGADRGLRGPGEVV